MAKNFPIANGKKSSHLKIAIVYHINYCQSKKNTCPLTLSSSFLRAYKTFTASVTCIVYPLLSSSSTRPYRMDGKKCKIFKCCLLTYHFQQKPTLVCLIAEQGLITVQGGKIYEITKRTRPNKRTGIKRF